MYFDQAKFGCRLRTLRKRRRMTQETLAGALNISIDHLSKIEHGKRGVSIDLLLDISEAVDTSLDYLLKGTAHTPLQMKEMIGRLQELHDQMAVIYENPDYPAIQKSFWQSYNLLKPKTTAFRTLKNTAPGGHIRRRITSADGPLTRGNSDAAGARRPPASDNRPMSTNGL